MTLVLAITRASLCVFALAGCALFVCHPVTVTVANKKELARLETVPGAMRTIETGRLEEDVRQSWTEGAWAPRLRGAIRRRRDRSRARDLRVNHSASNSSNG